MVGDIQPVLMHSNKGVMDLTTINIPNTFAIVNNNAEFALAEIEINNSIKCKTIVDGSLVMVFHCFRQMIIIFYGP
jgi:hypothetical protein